MTNLPNDRNVKKSRSNVRVRVLAESLSALETNHCTRTTVCAITR